MPQRRDRESSGSEKESSGDKYGRGKGEDERLAALRAALSNELASREVRAKEMAHPHKQHQLQQVKAVLRGAQAPPAQSALLLA